MKNLRQGFSTGAAAAAATKAAVWRLLGHIIDRVDLDLPNGTQLVIPISQTGFEPDGSVYAEVIKDGGDDPDVTNGIVIKSIVKRASTGVKISGGRGVGRVTRPGLPVVPGEPAINPTPKKMINDVLANLPVNHGWEVTIEVPEGEKVAAKTLNPRLGIVGGISILGTTGIVEPMSEEAWQDSLAVQLSVIKAAQYQTVVLTPGRQGINWALKLGIPEGQLAEMSNFVGFMLDKCREMGFHSVLLWGHFGKLLKVAAGNFNTHNRIADGRLETLTAIAAISGVKIEILKAIWQSNTTEEAVAHLSVAKMDRIVLDKVAERISERVRERTGGLKAGTVILDREGSVRGINAGAFQIIEAEQWKMNW